jgi:uncharacterized protein YPO0396
MKKIYILIITVLLVSTSIQAQYEIPCKITLGMSEKQVTDLIIQNGGKKTGQNASGESTYKDALTYLNADLGKSPYITASFTNDKLYSIRFMWLTWENQETYNKYLPIYEKEKARLLIKYGTGNNGDDKSKGESMHFWMTKLRSATIHVNIKQFSLSFDDDDIKYDL